jgi:hypothetical protein
MEAHDIPQRLFENLHELLGQVISSYGFSKLDEVNAYIEKFPRMNARPPNFVLSREMFVRAPNPDKDK